MYSLKTTKTFDKQFKKLDKSVQRTIISWIKKHLMNCENPRTFGKGLTYNSSGYWRYRIGNYRLICEIEDEELIIIAVSIAHRSTIYKEDNQC